MRRLEEEKRTRNGRGWPVLQQREAPEAPPFAARGAGLEQARRVVVPEAARMVLRLKAVEVHRVLGEGLAQVGGV